MPLRFNLIGYQDLSMPNQQDLVKYGRTCPMGACPLCYPERTGHLKLFRIGLYQCHMSPLFFVAVEHAVGIDNRALVMKVTYIFDLPRIPVNTYPFAIVLISEIGTVEISIYQYNPMILVIEGLVPVLFRNRSAIGSYFQHHRGYIPAI